MRDIETIDSELRLVAALRHAAQERGSPLPSIRVADALLDERRERADWVGYNAPQEFSHVIAVTRVRSIDGPLPRTPHAGARSGNSSQGQLTETHMTSSQGVTLCRWRQQSSY